LGGGCVHGPELGVVGGDGVSATADGVVGTTSALGLSGKGPSGVSGMVAAAVAVACDWEHGWPNSHVRWAGVAILGMFVSSAGSAGAADRPACGVGAGAGFDGESGAVRRVMTASCAECWCSEASMSCWRAAMAMNALCVAVSLNAAPSSEVDCILSSTEARSAGQVERNRRASAPCRAFNRVTSADDGYSW
jgi:hypothetical protein